MIALFLIGLAFIGYHFAGALGVGIACLLVVGLWVIAEAKTPHL